MSKRINTTWKQIPSDQAKLRASNLLKIIAKAEERMKQQGKTWSANGQDESRVDEKECASVSAGN